MTREAALVGQLAENLKRHGFSVHFRVTPEIEGATVSDALYALADPGSVVIAASPEEPRARSLLPDVHITRVTEDRVLPGIDELFALVGHALPSSLAIVSGPSRSADIEQLLALGVHGPREEHVVILPAQT
jgi:L-lactate dehydrogenase complex protein LldG